MAIKIKDPEGDRMFAELTSRISELEKRLRDLEARPVYVPYVPYVPPSQPHHTSSPWEITWR